LLTILIFQWENGDSVVRSGIVAISLAAAAATLSTPAVSAIVSFSAAGQIDAAVPGSSFAVGDLASLSVQYDDSVFIDLTPDSRFFALGGLGTGYTLKVGSQTWTETDSVLGTFLGFTPTSSGLEFLSFIVGALNSSGSFVVSDGTLLGGYGGLITKPNQFLVGSERAGLEALGSLSAAIPEPSTWALGILGFASIGGMMRKRYSVRSKTTFRMA
jgi:hypothetical protein